jgi:hypothetical protein
MPAIIDCHVHVGLCGDQWPQWGGMSAWFQRQFVFQIFLLYAGLKPDHVSDQNLHKKGIETIAGSDVDHVVCLALDPVYTPQGVRNTSASHLWVDNEYVLYLQKEPALNQDGKQRVLFGASVHPYDPQFRDRVKKYIDLGAVLLKWVPSSQQIDLADARIGSALEFLATAKGGKPLPLLLHCGAEYAIPTSNHSTQSHDFLEWGWTDKILNLFHRPRWYSPDISGIHENLRKGLRAGAVIIFAHAGLPYYFGGWVGKLFEHSDYDSVRDYLAENTTGRWPGKCYADVSALCTPIRRAFYPDIRKLPQEFLLFGSDFPTPAFELSADLNEVARDFKDVMKGNLQSIVIPQGNLISVNHRELNREFPGHPMFTNLSRLLSTSPPPSSSPAPSSP